MKTNIVLVLLVFFGIFQNSYANSYTPNPPTSMVFNNTQSMMCYQTGSNWGTYNLLPKHGAYVKDQSNVSSWVTYNIRASSTGDCSNNSPYMGTVTLTFKTGVLTYKNLQPADGSTFAIQQRPVDQCSQPNSTGLNCYMFLINPSK